jgi:hypothetical protein
VGIGLDDLRRIGLAQPAHDECEGEDAHRADQK